MQVYKVTVALVNDPLVGTCLVIEIGTRMWADQTLPLSGIFVAFMISNLYLKLNVVTNVGVLPHEEFDTDWVLRDADPIMQLTFAILNDLSWHHWCLLTELLSRIRGIHPTLALIHLE